MAAAKDAAVIIAGMAAVLAAASGWEHMLQLLAKADCLLEPIHGGTDIQLRMPR